MPGTYGEGWPVPKKPLTWPDLLAQIGFTKRSRGNEYPPIPIPPVPQAPRRIPLGLPIVEMGLSFNDSEPNRPALQGLRDVRPAALSAQPAPSVQPPAFPPKNAEALAFLQNVRPDPSLTLDVLQSRRQHELEQRMSRALEFGNEHEASGLKFALEALQGQMAESPLVAQRAQTEAVQKARQQAALAGFGSPQEEAAYGRRQKEFELQQPERLAGVEQTGALSRQQEASRGALAVARDKAAAQQEALSSFLQGGQVQPGGRVSISGVGSVSAPRQGSIAPVLLRDVMAARNVYQQIGGRDTGYLGGPTPQKVALDQAIASAFSAHPASADIKSTVVDIMSDPSLKNLSTQAIVDSNLFDLDPDEINDLSDLLEIMRGHI